MILVFLGPPGSGKGTQAKKLSAMHHWPQLSTGDMLRSAIKNRTPIGIEAEKHMASGGLAPDSLVVGIIRDRIHEPDALSGFILDGFPRTVPQAQALDQMLKELGRAVDSVILFDIPDQALVSRLSGRRTCLNCGAMFHVETMKPKKDGVCDTCQSALVQREDDHEQVIKNRLKIYHQSTEPVVDYYKKTGKLRVLDAALEPSKVNELVNITLAALAQ